MGHIWKQSILLIFFIIPSVHGMGRMIEDYSEHPEYSSYIGTVLNTKQELVIYKTKGFAKYSLKKFGDRVPEKVDMKNKFPFRHYDYKILGILPEGSTLEIIKVKREGSSTANFIYMYGKIILSENKSFEGKIFDVSWLNDRNEPPTFLPELVEIFPKK